jgi:hypothetical protein
MATIRRKMGHIGNQVQPLVANCLIYHNVCSLTSVVRELQKAGKEVKKFPKMRWHVSVHT